MLISFYLCVILILQIFCQKMQQSIYGLIIVQLAININRKFAFILTI